MRHRGIWTRNVQAFCGLVELRAIDSEHALAELRFWSGVDAWGRGYMSEASGAVLRLAFQDLWLNRAYAYHMVRNPASGRVLACHGLRVEGVLRERVAQVGGGDALLCAVPAAWAWTRRGSGFGLPGCVDPLEGWIVDPKTLEYACARGSGQSSAGFG
jgi:RimJ/RimL family protein N-acetyltransferase